MNAFKGFVQGVKDGWGNGLPTWVSWTIKIGFVVMLAYILYNK